MALQLLNYANKCLHGIGECLIIRLSVGNIYIQTPTYDGAYFQFTGNPADGDTITFFAGTTNELTITFSTNSADNNVLIGATLEDTLNNLKDKASLYSHFIYYNAVVALPDIFYLEAQQFGTATYNISNTTVNSSNITLYASTQGYDGQLLDNYHISAYVYDEYSNTLIMDYPVLLPAINPNDFTSVTCNVDIQYALLKTLTTALYTQAGFYNIAGHTKRLKVLFNEQYNDANGITVSTKLQDFGIRIQAMLAAENLPWTAGLSAICSCSADVTPPKLLTFMPSHKYRQCVTTPVVLHAYICAPEGTNVEYTMFADVKIDGQEPVETVVLHQGQTDKSITVGYNVFLCEDPNIQAAVGAPLCESPCSHNVSYIDVYTAFEASGNPIDFSISCADADPGAPHPYAVTFTANWPVIAPLFGILPDNYEWEYANSPGGPWVQFANGATEDTAVRYFEANNIELFFVRLTITLPGVPDPCVLTAMRGVTVGGCMVRAGFTLEVTPEEEPEGVGLNLTNLYVPLTQHRHNTGAGGYITQSSVTVLTALIGAQTGLDATLLNCEILISQSYTGIFTGSGAQTTVTSNICQGNFATPVTPQNNPVFYQVEINFEYAGHCYRLYGEYNLPPMYDSVGPLTFNVPLQYEDLTAGLTGLFISGTNTATGAGQISSTDYGYYVGTATTPQNVILNNYTPFDFTASPLNLTFNTLPQNGVIYMVQVVNHTCNLPELFYIIPITYQCAGCQSTLTAAITVTNETLIGGGDCAVTGGTITVSSIAGNDNLGYSITIYDENEDVVATVSSNVTELMPSLFADELPAGQYTVLVLGLNGCTYTETVTIAPPPTGIIYCGINGASTMTANQISIISGEYYFYFGVHPLFLSANPALEALTGYMLVEYKFNEDGIWTPFNDPVQFPATNGNPSLPITGGPQDNFFVLLTPDIFPDCGTTLFVRFRKVCCAGTGYENMTAWIVRSFNIIMCPPAQCEIQNLDAFLASPAPDCNDNAPVFDMQVTWHPVPFPVKVTVNGVTKANNYTGNQLTVTNMPANGANLLIAVSNVNDPACEATFGFSSPACSGCTFTFDSTATHETSPIGGPANGDGTITITAFNNGIPTFAYALYDNTNTLVTNGNTATAPLTITSIAAGQYNLVVQDGNHCVSQNTVIVGLEVTSQPPVAIDDYFTLQCVNSVFLPVLMDDFDPDDIPVVQDYISIQSVTTPTHGTAVIQPGSMWSNGDGILYTPDPNYIGTDSFEYTIIDLTNNTATATVSILILPCCSMTLSYTISSCDAQTGMVQLEVTLVTAPLLNNTADLIKTGQTSPVGVFSTLAGTSILTLNVFGTGDTIELTALGTTTNGAPCNSNTLSITLPTCNVPPIATDESATTSCNTPVSINVMSNDDDLNIPFGDTITLTHVEGNAVTPGGAPVGVANGTVALLIDGETLQFTPDTNYTGTTTFEYTITDSFGGLTGTATVTVEVLNDCDPCNGCTPVFTTNTYTAPTGINTYNGSIQFTISGCTGPYVLRTLKENSCFIYDFGGSPTCIANVITYATYSTAPGTTFTIGGLRDDGTANGSQFTAIYEDTAQPGCFVTFYFTMKAPITCTDLPLLSFSIERDQNLASLFATNIAAIVSYYKNGATNEFSADATAIQLAILSSGATINSILHQIKNAITGIPIGSSGTGITFFTSYGGAAYNPVHYELTISFTLNGHSMSATIRRSVAFCNDYAVPAGRTLYALFTDNNYINGICFHYTLTGIVNNPIATDIVEVSTDNINWAPVSGTPYCAETRLSLIYFRRTVTFLNGCPPVSKTMRISAPVGQTTYDAYCFTNVLLPSLAVINNTTGGCCTEPCEGNMQSGYYRMPFKSNELITYINANPPGATFTLTSMTENGVPLALPPSPTTTITQGNVVTTNIPDTYVTNLANWLNSLFLTMGAKTTCLPATTGAVMRDAGFIISTPAQGYTGGGGGCFSFEFIVQDNTGGFEYKYYNGAMLRRAIGGGTWLVPPPPAFEHVVRNIEDTNVCPNPDGPDVPQCLISAASFVYTLVNNGVTKEIHVVDTTTTAPIEKINVYEWLVTNIDGTAYSQTSTAASAKFVGINLDVTQISVRLRVKTSAYLCYHEVTQTITF